MFLDFWYLNFPCIKLFLTERGSEKIFVTLFSSFFHEILDIFQWKLYFGGDGNYPSHNKQCIQTNLDTEHNIKREFGAISWLVGLYVCWNSNSTWFYFASYVYLNSSAVRQLGGATVAPEDHVTNRKRGISRAKCLILTINCPGVHLVVFSQGRNLDHQMNQ